MTTRKPLLTVFYDGGCPACRREMAHYRRLPGAEAIDFVDICSDVAPLTAVGLDRAAAMARLHARDASGRWHIGVPAFIALWLLLPRYARWAKRLRPILDSRALAWAYERFCQWRLPRRCGPGGCPTPEVHCSASADRGVR